MNLRSVKPALRLWSAVALVTLIAAFFAAGSRQPAAAQAPAPPGLRALERDGLVRLESAGRFALTLDASGIQAWHDLQIDPGRAENLVPAGGPLLAHRLPDGASLSAAPRLDAASPLKARVVWEGQAAGAPFRLAYTVWAGGQVGVELRGPAELTSELRLAPAASVGAVLQPLSDRPAPAGRERTFMLYLDSWAADGAAPAAAAPEAAPAAAADGRPAPAALDRLNSLAVAAPAGARELTVSPPPAMVHQPRISVAGWPGGPLSVYRGETLLVAGADYLADYDAAAGRLELQYLGLLPQSADPAERSFRLAQTNAGPAVALGIRRADNGAPRSDVNESGMLVVNANLPTEPDNPSNPGDGAYTTHDIFQIPYIQPWGQLRLTATAQEAPDADSARFRVTGPGGFSQEVVDSSAADGYTAEFSLPARGEYRAVVELRDGGTVLASDVIDPVGYGRIFVSVGDSITSGKNGYLLRSGDAGYPVTSPPAQGGAIPVSADGRNYPQYDNTKTSPSANDQYAGYQVALNDLLSECLASPVFILNDGFSDIRAGRDLYDPKGEGVSPGIGTAGRDNVLGKDAAYERHIELLGAEHVLLGVGTNDASSVASNSDFNNRMPPEVFRADLKAAVQALRDVDTTAPQIFLARIPWRDDGGTQQLRDGRRENTRLFNREIEGLAQDDAAVAAYTELGPELYSHFAANQSQISSDKLHPTQQGLDEMARLWAAGDPALSLYPSPPAGFTPARSAGLCAALADEPDPPTPTFTRTPTHTPTKTPTLKPGAPTSTPTRTPTLRPGAPTSTPTRIPTTDPAKFPFRLNLPLLRR